MEELLRAFEVGNAGSVRRLLDRARVNEPLAAFDAPLVTRVRSREMLDVLLEAGADINAKSRWWAGGFGLLDCAEPELAAYAIERGAVVDVHAAARLGLMEKLQQLVGVHPDLVRARGGDGQTPLHCASTVAIAEYLLDQGADINARDVDHESTAAQYMVRDRQEIVRCLVRRGSETDLLMAAALGDAELACKHLDRDPECIRLRVSDEYFPKSNPESGGTIYQWTLGWHVSAHQVARQFGHEELYRQLLDRTPPDARTLVLCWEGELGLKLDPAGLSAAERRQMAHAARNDDLVAVKAMLAAGLSVLETGQHAATPLHWAAWHGNAEMVRAILEHNPPLEGADNDFHSTPLQWARHGSENGWHRERGDYGAVVALLSEALEWSSGES